MKLAWSCKERDRENCRNADGCHCREITALISGRGSMAKALADIIDLASSVSPYALSSKAKKRIEAARGLILGDVGGLTK